MFTSCTCTSCANSLTYLADRDALIVYLINNKVVEFFQAFTSNNRATITTIDKSKQHLIGNRHGHSFRDVKLSNMMYKCNSKLSGRIPNTVIRTNSTVSLFKGDDSSFSKWLPWNFYCDYTVSITTFYVGLWHNRYMLCLYNLLRHLSDSRG